jgi:flagellar M-ring protein FliF
MPGFEQLEKLTAGFLQLGTKKLVALGVIGLMVMAAVGLSSFYLTRPDYDTLYTGLTPQDVSRVGAALREAGIPFDISSDATKVMVHPSQTAEARAMLAEKGLPSSSTGGYELFDKLGTVGLTSFMQEITKVRALEGEISRTVQAMKGVKAARVHIVLPETSSFRQAKQLASASVVIRTETSNSRPLANAIRHLVAAAVPGMTVDQVSVLNTDGTVFAGGNEGDNPAPGKMVDLEKTVSREMQENVRKTLAPYLGFDNFEVSVAARLNLDKRQTNENTFDPDSKVERSVRTVKETGSSQNSNNRTPVGVEQNIPGEQQAAQGTGDQSKRQNERKEDLTNYEISSKTVQTVSEGYRIEALTIAVIVNRKRLAAGLGDNATAEQIQPQIAEIEKLVSSAAGLDSKRGDRVTVSAVDFLQGGALEPVSGPSIVELMLRHTGSVINGAVILAATLLLIWFGLRPAINVLREVPAGGGAALEGGGLAMDGIGGPGGMGGLPGLGSPDGGGVEPPPFIFNSPPPPFVPNFAQYGDEPAQDLVGDLAGPDRTPQKRLEQIVDLNEEQAAAVLKQWVRS